MADLWNEYLAGWRALERKVASGEYAYPITALVYGPSQRLGIVISGISVSRGKFPEVTICREAADPIVATESSPYGFKEGCDAKRKIVFLFDI